MWSAARSPARPAFPPDRLLRAISDTLTELLRHLLPSRRLRSNPRVVKRKMSNFGVKRATHRRWPQPTRTPAEALVLLPASRPVGTRRPACPTPATGAQPTHHP